MSIQLPFCCRWAFSVQVSVAPTPTLKVELSCPASAPIDKPVGPKNIAW